MSHFVLDKFQGAFFGSLASSRYPVRLTSDGANAPASRSDFAPIGAVGRSPKPANQNKQLETGFNDEKSLHQKQQ